MRVETFTVLGFVLVGVCLLAGTGGASHAISNCGTVANSGAHTLDTDLTDRTEASCIQVTASDVVLDGGGNTVEGTDGSGTVGINVSSSGTLTNVTVRNFTVTDWEVGISYKEVDGVEVTDNNLTSNVQKGIHLEFTDDSKISNNTAFSNDEHGIQLATATNNEVTNNTAIGNRFVGIYLINSDMGSIVMKNNATANRRGIRLQNAKDAMVKNNNASGNTNGIVVEESDNITVTNNKANSNDFSGIRIFETGETEVKDNEGNSNDMGFMVGGLSNGNTFTNNTARDNNDKAFLSQTSLGFTNTIKNLNIGASNTPNTRVSFEAEDEFSVLSVGSPPDDPPDGRSIGRYVRVEDAFPGSSLRVSYNDSDVSGINESKLSMRRYDGSWTFVPGTNGVDTAENEVFTDVSSTGVFAPISNNTITSSTDINRSGVYRVTDDMTDINTSSFINITASNITLDGGGNTVDGTDEPGSAGINITSATTLTNVTVTNLTVTGWDDGIHYDEVDNGSIINVDASLNTNGVSLASSNDNRIVDSNLSSNLNDGLSLASSDGNEIVGNRLSSNLEAGIELNTSNGNNVSDNEADSNGDDGLTISDSVDNVLTSNSVTDNSASGISLSSSETNQLSDNTVTDNVGSGISLDSSVDNSLTDNTASDNDGSDFVSTAGSIGNTVTGLSINPTLTFERSKDIAITSVADPPADPSRKTNVNQYVNVTGTSDDSFVFLNVSYDDADVTDADEPSLRIWKNDGIWSQVPGTNGVDTEANVVFANITSFSVFAPLADMEVSGPGAGGGCVDRRNLSRGQEGQECPRDRGLGRGESREDLDRETGRNSDTARRDRGRDERGRSR
jgi:parallel beta-helix repeat protein